MTSSISGNDINQTRVNPHGTGLADHSQPQSSRNPNGDQGRGGPHDSESLPEIVLQGTQVADASNRRTQRRQVTQEKKLAVRIASLNMNGFGRLMTGHPENKWGNIYRVMKEQRIAVLMLQETHLMPERVLAVERMTAHNIKIFCSPNQERPTAREGVAVVLNKKLLKAGAASAQTVVPGCALQVSVPWHGNEVLEILCIYAPTSDGEAVRKAFFETVSRFYREHPRVPRPAIMAGDFNNVEDMVDRMPMGGGPDSSVEAMDDLKLNLNLLMTDGWRMVNPTKREFTFQRGETFARLDRIYVEENTSRRAHNWKIHEGLIRSDHNMISMDLVCISAPKIGKGRPTFSTYLIQDKKTTKYMRERGLRALREIADMEASGVRSEQQNPQMVLADMKSDWLEFAREREKAMVPRLLAEIRDLEAELKCIKRNATMSDEEKAPSMAALATQIQKLQEKQLNQMKAGGKAKHRIEGERPTKYWTRLHKEKKPWDIMLAFEKEHVRAANQGGVHRTEYEADSRRMAGLARDYHEDLQKDKPEDNRAGIDRNIAIDIALNAVEVKVSDIQAEELGEDLTWDECDIALRFSKSGSAPGLDGLPYDLWKVLHARFIEDSRHDDRTPFDIITLLLKVFWDVQINGVSETAGFADGWMCPIYKEKGELTKIANYRPITLLNTDYKLLTKVLAIRLADVAPDIVHRSQAGFVPGRRLHDHTQLAKMMIEWAEQTEQNGAIVALDQEKAYDRIAHDYLWKVMERFGIPDSFVSCLKNLYANARTSVMVNGVLSSPFRVYRGVRQGDPISCLLFDLAIEPLSVLIRNSELEGFLIPGTAERLKATLFADDTTVYLSEHDNFSILQNILDTWCTLKKQRFSQLARQCSERK